MQGRIQIQIESELAENEFTNLDEELRELMIDLGVSCTIYDEITESTISLE